jgi:hypothetical protein
VLLLLAVPASNLILRDGHPSPTSATRELVHSFRIAIISFQTEYNQLPARAIGALSEGDPSRSRGEILNALLGKSPEINPRGIKFIDPPEARDRKRGLYDDDKGSPVLVDQWGEPFYFVLDLNNDHSIPNPDPRPDQPRELATDMIVFSAGPDRDPNTWKDNVTSW